MGKNIKFFLAAVFLVFVLSSVSAVTYYIDFQNGNDANNGISSANAWKTIPGTMNNCDTSNPQWKQSSWGGGVVSINSNRIMAGTTFKLKPGSVFNNTVGGCIWIMPYFYNDNATISKPITFTVDSAQGTSPVIFNFQNIPQPNLAISGITNQINGVSFDGVNSNGIIFENSPVGGVEFKEKAGAGEAIKECSFKNLKFFNNGYSFLNDLAGSGSGQLNLRKVNGCIIDNLELDGNNNFINGILMGDDHFTALNVTISNSISYNHRGDLIDNDAGIGFKAQNGQITFINLTSFNNLKGFDLGEQHSDGADIVYKVINSLIYNNNWGVNFNNNPYDSTTHLANYYIINSIIRDNREGTNTYSGPYNLYLIHNVYANNGVANESKAWDAWNLRVSPDSCQDQTPINVYFYNNIFYKPFGYSNFFNAAIGDGSEGYDTNFNLHSDYNSWVQNDTEYFAYLAGYNCAHRAPQFPAPGGITYEHSYGVDGPGHASGKWYSSEDEPMNGTGHIGDDAHSKGTGSSDSSLPPFRNVSTKDYTLTNHYNGISLDSQPWYISEMGFDRNGNRRTSWDIGAYEYISTENKVDLFNKDNSLNSTFTNITACANVVSAGQTCLVHDGIYRENVIVRKIGTLTNPITIKSINIHGAIIDGSENLIGWTKCLSQNTCGGNPNWQNIYVTSISNLPSFLDENIGINLNIYQDETPITPAQFPISTNNMYQVTTNYYNVSKDNMTTTSLIDSRLALLGGNSLVGSYIYLWVNPNEVEIRKILSFDSNNNKITFQYADVYLDRDTKFAVANSMLGSVFKKAGQYYFNESAELDGSHKLYVWPLDNLDLTTNQRLTISRRSVGVLLTSPSTHVILDGFKIQKQTGDNNMTDSQVIGSEGDAIRINQYGSFNIINNEITMINNPGSAAITTYDIKDSMFENNYIHDTRGLGRGIQTSGNNISVRNNLFQRVSRTPIYFGNVNSGNIINNTILDSTGVHSNGISVYEGSYNINVTNNLVRNSNIAMTIQNSGNISITNNIFDSSYNRTDYTGDPYSTPVFASWGGISGINKVMNNIIMGSMSHYSFLWNGDYDLNGTIYIIKNNIIDGGTVFGNIASDMNYNIYTNITWNNNHNSGWTLGAGDKIELNISKLFVDYFNSDYHIPQNSSTIDSGVNLAGIVDYDKDGNVRPQGSGWDIGAYEYNSGFVQNNYHIADTNTDNNISSLELNNYISGYLSGSYNLKNALYLITLKQKGGKYNYNSSSNCDLIPWNCWTSI